MNIVEMREIISLSSGRLILYKRKLNPVMWKFSTVKSQARKIIANFLNLNPSAIGAIYLGLKFRLSWGKLFPPMLVISFSLRFF